MKPIVINPEIIFKKLKQLFNDGEKHLLDFHDIGVEGLIPFMDSQVKMGLEVLSKRNIDIQKNLIWQWYLDPEQSYKRMETFIGNALTIEDKKFYGRLVQDLLTEHPIEAVIDDYEDWLYNNADLVSCENYEEYPEPVNYDDAYDMEYMLLLCIDYFSFMGYDYKGLIYKSKKDII